MRLSLACLVILSTLTSAEAAATPPCETNLPLPRFDIGSGETLLRSEHVFVFGSHEVALSQALTAPDGGDVLWEVRDSDFGPQVEIAEPAGGWQVGEYLDAGGNARIVILDDADDVAPSPAVGSWQGRDANPLDINCALEGVDGDTSGATITLADAELPLLYTWRRLDADGSVVDEDWGWAETAPRLRVRAPSGAESTIEFTVCDLSLNCADGVVADVVGCAGCSGDMAGPGAPFGIALLVGLLGLGLRRRA